MNDIRPLHAPKPRSTTVRNIAWLYAGVLTVMAVGQLFSFEKFTPLIDSYWLPGGHGTGMLVACLIVITEVFALPFLLRMDLSPLMRWFSLVCSALVPLLWLSILLFEMSTHWILLNSGLFGTKVAIPSGMGAVTLVVILLGLAAVSVWGLWPLYKKTAVKK